MANTALTADIVAKAALAVLQNELGVLNTLYRAHESEFAQRVNGYEVGDTVRIRRPADYVVRDGAVISTQDTIEGKVDLKVDQQKGVDIHFTSVERTLDIVDLTERVIQPAMINLVEEISRDVFHEFAKGIYNWVGTPGEVINSFADFSLMPERMDEMSVPQAMRHSALNPADYWGTINSQTGLFVDSVARPAIRDANLGQLGGVDTWMTQTLSSQTVGALGGTPAVDGAAQSVLYDTVKDTWAQTLNTKAWTATVTGVLKRGDVFTIADVFMVNAKTRENTGILQNFVVNADADSDGTGDAALNISPPIIITGPYQTVNAAPADSALMTVKGTGGATYKQSLAYHKNAMALAVVPMELPDGAYNAARRTQNGISIRVIPIYDGTNDNNLWRTDVLYARKLIDPRIAVKGSGVAAA